MLERGKKYCVYFHKFADTGKVFYVGICTIRRPFEKNKRSTLWKDYINKYAYLVEIIHKDLFWDEACLLEVEYIKEFGRRDQGLGGLINLTNGGDGVIGYAGYWKGKKRPEVKSWLKGVYRHDYKTNPMSQYIKDKIAASNKGRKFSIETLEKFKNRVPWNKGKTGFVSPKKGKKTGKPIHPNTKAALIKSLTGRKMSDRHKEIMSGVHKGKVVSIETRLKISNSVKEKWKKTKQIENVGF